MNHSRRTKAFERLKDMYLMPFRAVARLFRLFVRNRRRIREFVRRPRVSTVLTYGMLITMLLWFAIAALNRGEDDGRLTEALQGLWPQTGGSEGTTGPPAERSTGQ